MTSYYIFKWYSNILYYCISTQGQWKLMNMV